MSAKYKVVTHKQTDRMDKYLVYVGFERRDGFRWCTASVLCTSVPTALVEFADRNELKYQSVDEFVNLDTHNYDPNRGACEK